MDQWCPIYFGSRLYFQLQLDWRAMYEQDLFTLIIHLEFYIL